MIGRELLVALAWQENSYGSDLVGDPKKQTDTIGCKQREREGEKKPYYARLTFFAGQTKSQKI